MRRSRNARLSPNPANPSAFYWVEAAETTWKRPLNEFDGFFEAAKHIEKAYGKSFCFVPEQSLIEWVGGQP